MKNERNEKLTSLRNTAVSRNANAENPAAAAHGRKYGNLIQKECENSRGHLSWGLDSCPPINGLREIDQLLGDASVLYAPERRPSGPCNRDESKSLRDVGRVCQLCAKWSGPTMESDMRSPEPPIMLFMTPVLPLSIPTRLRLWWTSRGHEYGSCSAAYIPDYQSPECPR